MADNKSSWFERSNRESSGLFLIAHTEEQAARLREFWPGIHIEVGKMLEVPNSLLGIDEDDQ